MLYSTLLIYIFIWIDRVQRLAPGDLDRKGVKEQRRRESNDDDPERYVDRSRINPRKNARGGTGAP